MRLGGGPSAPRTSGAHLRPHNTCPCLGARGTAVEAPAPPPTCVTEGPPATRALGTGGEKGRREGHGGAGASLGRRAQAGERECARGSGRPVLSFFLPRPPPPPPARHRRRPRAVLVRRPQGNVRCWSGLRCGGSTTTDLKEVWHEVRIALVMSKPDIVAQTQVTPAGKHEVYHRENLVRPFLVYRLWGPRPARPNTPFKRSPGESGHSRVEGRTNRRGPLPLSAPLPEVVPGPPESGPARTAPRKGRGAGLPQRLRF